MSEFETWKLSDFAPDERPDAWRAVISETHLPWDIRASEAAGEDHAAWVRRRRMGDLALVECACPPCSGYRGRGQLRDTDGEFVGVLVLDSGNEVVSRPDTEIPVRPGTMLLWDSTRPTGFAALTQLSKRTLLIPRDRFAELFRRPEKTMGPQAMNHQASRLFGSYLRFLSDQAPDLDDTAATAAGKAALELLAAAVRPENAVSPETRHAAVRARINDYIDRNLADPGLNPQKVATAGCMSVRSLYLLFEKDGDTVSAYIRRRRLARGHADLVRPGRPYSITEIAFRWGFTDVAHFSRAFRREYGKTPTQVRRENLAAPSPPC